MRRGQGVAIITPKELLLPLPLLVCCCVCDLTTIKPCSLVTAVHTHTPALTPSGLPAAKPRPTTDDRRPPTTTLRPVPRYSTTKSPNSLRSAPVGSPSPVCATGDRVRDCDSLFDFAVLSTVASSSRYCSTCTVQYLLSLISDRERRFVQRNKTKQDGLRARPPVIPGSHTDLFPSQIDLGRSLGFALPGQGTLSIKGKRLKDISYTFSDRDTHTPREREKKREMRTT